MLSPSTGGKVYIYAKQRQLSSSLEINGVRINFGLRFGTLWTTSRRGASNDYSESFKYHPLVATHQVYAENPSSENLHCFAYRIHVNVFDRTKTDQFPARQARLLTWILTGNQPPTFVASYIETAVYWPFRSLEFDRTLCSWHKNISDTHKSNSDPRTVGWSGV